MLKLFRVAYARHSPIEVSLILSSVRCGFYSQNALVAELAMEVIERVTDELYKHAFEFGVQVKQKGRKNSVTEVRVPVFSQLQDWFIEPKKVGAKTRDLRKQKQLFGQVGDPNSALRILCTEVLDSHPQLALQVTRLLLAIFRPVDNTQKSLTIAHLPSKMAEVLNDDIFIVYSSISIIVPVMSRLDRGALQHILIHSDLIYDLLNRSSDQEKDTAVRLQCTTLLIDLWFEEATVIATLSQSSDMRSIFQEVLLAGATHQDKVYAVSVLGATFALFERTLQQRSIDSPQLFQTLISATVQIFRDRQDRVIEEHIMRNFTSIFDLFEDLPIHLLTEPLIAIMSERIKTVRQEGSRVKRGQITTEELAFIVKMSSHKRLGQLQAFAIIELLSVIYVGKPSVAPVLLPTITDLVNRFKDYQRLINFVNQILVTKALLSLITFKKDEQQIQAAGGERSQSVLAIQAGSTGQNHQSQRNSTTMAKLPARLPSYQKKQQTSLKIKIQRYQMVSLVEKLYECGVDSLMRIITEQVRALSQKYFQMFKQPSSGYNYLITRLKLDVPDVAEPQPLPVDSTKQSEIGDFDTIKSQKQSQGEKQRIEQKNKERLSNWQKAKDAKNDIALRAIEEMNQIKVQRIRKQQEQRIEEVKRKEREERIYDQAAIDRAMSKLLLEKDASQHRQRFTEKLMAIDGQVSQSDILWMSPFYENILASPILSGQFKPKLSSFEMTALLQFSRVPRDGIMLINFELEEEDRERDAMRLAVFRNQNLFANLFFKYWAPDKRMIVNTNLQKFFKDFELNLTSKELHALIRMINDLFLLRLGSQALEFAGFVQLIVQASIQMHRRGRVTGVTKEDASYMMYSHMVQNTLQHLREKAAPDSLDALTDDQKKIIQKGQPEVQSSQQIQKQIVLHQIPDSSRVVLGEAKTAVLELLDQILLMGVGVSIFESLIVDKLPDVRKTLNVKQAASKKKKEVKHKNASKQKGNDSFDDDGYGTPPEAGKKQPNYPLYTATLLARRLGSQNTQPLERRNLRKDRENETAVMQLPVSPDIKVACYELQQIRPQSELEDMREIAQTLEFVLQSVCGASSYRSSKDRKGKEVRSRRVSSTPKLTLHKPIVGTKLEEIVKKQQQDDLEKKQRRDQLYIKRGIELKQKLLAQEAPGEPNEYGTAVKPDKKTSRTQSHAARQQQYQSQPQLQRQESSNLKRLESISQTPDVKQRIPKVSQKKLDLKNYLKQKQIADVFEQQDQPLKQIFKDSSEIERLLQGRQTVEVLRLQRAKWVEFAQSRFGADTAVAGSIFKQVSEGTSDSFTFEQFRGALVYLAMTQLNFKEFWKDISKNLPPEDLFNFLTIATGAIPEQEKAAQQKGATRYNRQSSRVSVTKQQSPKVQSAQISPKSLAKPSRTTTMQQQSVEYAKWHGFRYVGQSKEPFVIDNFSLCQDKVAGYGHKYTIQGTLDDDTVKFTQKFEFASIDFRGNVNSERTQISGVLTADGQQQRFTIRKDLAAQTPEQQLLARNFGSDQDEEEARQPIESEYVDALGEESGNFDQYR